MRATRTISFSGRRARVLAAIGASLVAASVGASPAAAYTPTVHDCPLYGADFQSISSVLTLTANPSTPELDRLLYPGEATPETKLGLDLALSFASAPSVPVNGKLTVELSITGNGAPRTVKLAGDYSVPAASPNGPGRGVSIRTTATLPSFTFSEVGDADITVAGISFDYGPAAAEPVGFPGARTTVDCSISPGSSALQGRIFVVADPGPAFPEYALKGTASFKANARGTAPLTGSLTGAGINPDTGTFYADLNLDRITGNLKAFGFLPVRAVLDPSPTAKFIGTIKGDQLAASTGALFHLDKLSAFGVKLAGGNICATKRPSTIAVKSIGSTFTRETGGNLTATFALGEFENCGSNTLLVSALFTGAHSVKLAATPTAATPATT